MDRVYVANLPPDIRIKEIDDFFKPFGKLVYIDVNHRANPVYACVQFDNARNAFNAVRYRNGYNFDGYTLQLRLAESEVRNRRDATPPPSLTTVFNNYDRQYNDGGFNNSYDDSNKRIGGNFSNTSFQSNSNSLWSNSNNRSSMLQQNMIQYPVTNRLNMQQQNMDYSGNNRSSIQQDNTLFSSSGQGMQYSGRSDSFQQNTSYLDKGSSNMSQQGMQMKDCSNNGSWISGSNLDFNYSSSGNYNNGGSNEVFNSNNDSSGGIRFEENHTRGLSGSGRKWFNRYIRKGFTPEMARMKALEHRTVPYLRDDPKLKRITNDPTNAALETIGNTIMSLLSTTSDGNNRNFVSDNFQAGYGNMGGGNFDNPGPSSSKPTHNAVSRNQYFKSMRILDKLDRSRNLTAQDRISKKYHTQIVKDYEQFKKSLAKQGGIKTSRDVSRDMKKGISTSEAALSEELRKKKKELLMQAKNLGLENKRSIGGAQKKRLRILMNEAGFSELEAKALAVHPIEKLRPLISIKRDYDLAKLKPSALNQGKTKLDSKEARLVAYRNDLAYLSSYKTKRITFLSKRIKLILVACIKRIHKYEKEERIPLTEGKFVSIILKQYGNKKIPREAPNKENKGNKKIPETKKNIAETTTKNNEEEKTNNENSEDMELKTVKEEKIEVNANKDEVIDITEDENDQGEDGENQSGGGEEQDDVTEGNEQ